MEALLVKKNLWDVTSGVETKPLGSPNSKAVKSWTRKIAEAHSEIILHVEKSQYSHVRSQDAAEIWENLEMMHRTRGLATRLSLCRHFWEMKKKPDQPMSSWIADVRSIIYRLEEIGVIVEAEDQILVLTMGLPRTFENFIVALDSTPPDNLMLDYVIGRLLNEESRQVTTVNVAT